MDGKEILGTVTDGNEILAPDIFPKFGIETFGTDILGIPTPGNFSDSFNTFKFGSFGIVGSFGSVNFGRTNGGRPTFGNATEIQICGIATLRCNVFTIKSNSNCRGDIEKLVYKFFNCSNKVNSGMFNDGKSGSGNVESNGKPNAASAIATKFIITPISEVKTEIPFPDVSKIPLIIDNANVSKNSPKLGIVGRLNAPTPMICATCFTRPNRVLISAAK